LGHIPDGLWLDPPTRGCCRCAYHRSCVYGLVRLPCCYGTLRWHALLGLCGVVFIPGLTNDQWMFHGGCSPAPLYYLHGRRMRAWRAHTILYGLNWAFHLCAFASARCAGRTSLCRFHSFWWRGATRARDRAFAWRQCDASDWCTRITGFLPPHHTCTRRTLIPQPNRRTHTHAHTASQTAMARLLPGGSMHCTGQRRNKHAGQAGRALGVSAHHPTPPIKTLPLYVFVPISCSATQHCSYHVFSRCAFSHLFCLLRHLGLPICRCLTCGLRSVGRHVATTRLHWEAREETGGRRRQDSI